MHPCFNTLNLFVLFILYLLIYIQTTKGRGLKRGDSDYSEDGSEMSGSVVENSHAQVNAQPSGAGGRGGAGPRGHHHHRMATPQDR